MNETDDTQLKTEIDSIMERVNRIMRDVDAVAATPEETTEKAEE